MLTRLRRSTRCPSRWGLILSVTLAAQVPAWSADADTEDTEKARLASLVRQLDALERAAEHSAESSGAETARYRFDYARLTADIERIRSGIEDYLTPIRAQPRDLQPLSGQYRRQGPSR